MIKSCQLRTVKIEDAQQPFILDQGNHDFRTRRRVARDVPGKRMNIRNYDRLPALGGSAADPLTHCNPNAGYPALKGTEHELAPLQKIESDPVESRQCLVKQRRRIRCIRQTTALTDEQCAHLFVQLSIGSGFG